MDGSRRALFVVGLVSALSAPLAAEEPWLDRPFAAAPADVLRAAAAHRPPGDASVHVLYVGYDWTFDADGRRTLTTRRVYEILQEDARDDWGTVEAVWKPWLDEKPRLRARVVRKDGTAVDVDPSTVAEQPLASAPGVFDDRRILSAPLPGLEVGAVVELETVERPVRPFPGGDRASVSFGSSSPRTRLRLTVTVPESLPFTWRVRGPSVILPKESRAGGMVTRVWEAGETPANHDWEWSLPPDVLQSPLVEFGTGTSWASVADTYRKVVEDRMGGATFAAWGGGAKEPRDLLAFVQKQIRYTSIAFGESAIVPQLPKDVVSRRFGDCKDQATLLAGLLRSRGVEAWVALLNAGTGRDVNPEIAALAGFNHAIVYVAGPGGAAGTWVDPTSPFVRWGELPREDRDRWALVCRPGADSLVKTPGAAPGTDREIRTMEVRLAGDGKGSAVETVEYHGAYEASARSSYDGADSVALRKRAERYVQAALARGTLVRSSSTPTRDLGTPFRTTIEAAKVGFAQTTVSGASVRIGRSVLLDLAPTPAEEPRRFPLAVSPFEFRVEYHVVPPRGYVVREMPATGETEVGPLHVVTASSELPDGSVRLAFRVAMTASRLTPDESVAFFRARRDYDRLGGFVVAFDSRAERAVEQGHTREALAERNADVRLEPKSADAHRRLAYTLLRVGLGGAAIREAGSATKLDPASPAAWHQLGLALQHDRFGRLRQGTWDLPGAERALRKAVALDRESAEYRIDLAILLEYDATGTRYADRERLGDAITFYQETLKEHPELTLVRENLVLALLNADRAPEAVHLLESLGDEGRGHMLVAAWAMASGVDTALEKTRRAWGDPAARRDAEEKGALLLLFLRRYGLAADVMSDAARGSPRAGELSARADFFRRLKPIAGFDPEPGDAASVVRALFARLVAGEPLARLDALCVREEHGSEALKELRAVVLALQSQFAAAGLPQAVTRDLSFAAMEFRADGDAATGWRARVQAGLSGGSPSSFVARLAAEDGEPRVVGFDVDPRPYARLALRLARGGDLEGAARWLDRALDARAARGGDVEEDRLRGPLLPLFWTREGASRARRETIVLACAAEIVPGKLDEQTLADVRAAAAAAPQERKLGMLLVRALEGADRRDDARGVAADWRRREPDELVWALAETVSLQASGRYAEGARLMSASLERAPRDLWVLRFLRDSEGALGHFGRASELGARIVAMPDAAADDWNNLAWFRMLAGKNDAETLGQARRAVEATARTSAVVLNTLAAVLVEQGDLKEGYDVVVEAMRKAASDEPVNADWYVLGRILEEYGFAEDARDAFGRVEGKTSDASGVAALSRRRLAGLGTAHARP